MAGFDYRKVGPTLWTGATGRWLRKQPRYVTVVAVYLMTCPSSTQWGLFYLPCVYIANDTGCTVDEVEVALERLQAHGFCRYDTEAEVVWVVNMCRDQVGEIRGADKRAKPAAEAARELLGMPFGPAWYWHYQGALQLPECPIDAPSDAPSMPLPESADAPSMPEAGAGAGEEQKQNTSAPAEPVRAQPVLISVPAAPRFDFDAVYARYPRKKGKHAGMDSCAKLIRTTADFEALSRGVDAFVAEQKRLRTPPDKIPYWSTWVNERRWEDFTDEPVAVPRKSLEDAMAAGECP